MKRPADVIPINRAPTWAAVRREYERMTQMGWQSVQQAAEVGRLLIELKAETPHGEFTARSNFMPSNTRAVLMKLAAHRALIEKRKPDSQRAALALIPKKKRATKATEPDVDLPDDDADEEEPITQKKYENVFEMRASSIRGVVRAIEHYAQFGTPTQPMIAELRAIARLIETVAQKLETRT